MLPSLKETASQCLHWSVDQISRMRRGERVVLKTVLQAALALWVVSAGVSFALVNLGPDASLMAPKTMQLKLNWEQLQALSPSAETLTPLPGHLVQLG